MKVMLGTGMPRWSHACWDWMHRLDVIPEGMLLMMPSILPCPICSMHMARYILQNPLYEPHREWIIDLHNDVNIRTNKAVVEYEDVPVRPMNSAGLTQFLFVVAFMLPVERTDDFWEFCGLALQTLPGNVTLQRPLQYVHPSQVIWRELTTVYTNYHDVVVDFIPPRLYHQYLPLSPPPPRGEGEDDEGGEGEVASQYRRSVLVVVAVCLTVLFGLAVRNGSLCMIVLLAVLLFLYMSIGYHLY